INATLTGSALASAIQTQLNLVPGVSATVTPGAGNTYNIAFTSPATTPFVALNRSGLTGGSITFGNGALESVYGLNTVSSVPTVNTNVNIGVDAGTLTVSGAIGGAGDVNKIGGGTLILSGANTYTGQTNINNGIVQANNGSALGTVVGPAVVNSGAT